MTNDDESLDSPESRVLRGGSFYGNHKGARAAIHHKERPNLLNDFSIGFRLALTGSEAVDG
jgi:formylglycine-generating enzyme required for sulfatase activity